MEEEKEGKEEDAEDEETDEDTSPRKSRVLCVSALDCVVFWIQPWFPH